MKPTVEELEHLFKKLRKDRKELKYYRENGFAEKELGFLRDAVNKTAAEISRMRRRCFSIGEYPLCTVVSFFGTGDDMVMVCEQSYSDGGTHMAFHGACYLNYIRFFFDRIRYDNRHLKNGEERYEHMMERKTIEPPVLCRPGSNWSGD